MRRVCRSLVLLLLAVPSTAAAWDESDVHWAYRKPTCPEPTARDVLKHGETVRNPIDRFVLERLESTGLEPAPRAAPWTTAITACGAASTCRSRSPKRRLM